MIIKDGFYLNGFTRIDKGEAGAVFVRFGARRNGNAPAIEEMQLKYGGKGTANYLITIPPQTVVECAIITRSSRNCYQAAVYDERRIKYFKADTLDGLRRAVAAFFEGETA